MRHFLPINSIHPIHMKRSTIFTMLLRPIRYYSSFQSFMNESEKLRITLLLNKYSNDLINQEFESTLKKFNIFEHIKAQNYEQIRLMIISSPQKEKQAVDYGSKLFVHFTYCSHMRTFPIRFHTVWNKYFSASPINDVIPILGTSNTNNLQL